MKNESILKEYYKYIKKKTDNKSIYENLIKNYSGEKEQFIRIEKERIDKEKQKLNSPYISIVVTLIAMLISALAAIFSDEKIMISIMVAVYFIVYSLLSVYNSKKIELINISLSVLQEMEKELEENGDDMNKSSGYIEEQNNSKKQLHSKRTNLEFINGIAIVIFLLFLGVIIALIFKLKYDDYLDAADYMNFIGQFGGAILGGIISVFILYKTVKQTREIQEQNTNIQERLINIEENKRKSDLRTNFQEILIESDIKLEKYTRSLEGALVIITEDYKYIENLFDNSVEYFKIKTSIGNGQNNSFANVAEFESIIENLKNFKKYIFRLISNIGDNTMYNVGIKMHGLWFEAHNKSFRGGEMEFTIDYIEKGKKILLPLFKFDEKLMLWQFNPERVTLYYYTGTMGDRERIITKTIYNLQDQKIDKRTIVEQISSDESNRSSSFLEYKML